jgi:hemolysin activation/secretion protein
MKHFDDSLLRKKFLVVLSLFLVVGFHHHTATAENPQPIYLAQTPAPDDVNAPVPPLRDFPTPEPSPTEPLPPIDDLLESPETPPGAAPPEVEPAVIEVKQFQIEGNTVFDDAEIQALLADFTNQTLSFADLLQVETIITELYTDNGYINSGAVVPAQDINDGIVTVQVIEGRIEDQDIQITVDGRLSKDYILARLKRGTKAPLNVNELQEALQLLQLDPLIENINAELSVGTNRDRWRLTVDVDQAQAFRPVIFANNSRTPSVGSFQRGIELNHNNFTGVGDRASFIYKNTDGSNDFDFNYTVPLNALNGTLGLGYRYIDSDIVESPFDELDIESETDEYQINFRQPIIVRATANSTQELALGVEFSRQANTTTVEDRPLQLSAGSELDGETKIYALRFFQDWTRRSRQEVLALRSQFSVGLDAFDATINQNAPDGNFFAWRGQAQWLRQLDADSKINLLLRSDIQLSANDLVALEQFSLGGIQSVRGYRQDALLGDSGLLFSAEVRIPVVDWSEGQSNLSVIPFADVGTVWSDPEVTDQEEATLVALGLGLQLIVSDRLRARLDWGIPLIEVADRDNTLQENGVYFSLEYLPF